MKIVVACLINALSSKESMDYYANKSSLSPRTLSRLFNKELGMNYGDWKMRLKLIEAVKQLGE